MGSEQGYNKALFIGRMTKDIEMRYTNEGKAIGNFSLAVTTGFGEKARTLFIRVVCFSKTAEFLSKYTEKGHKLFVEGELQIRSYEKDHKTEWVTEIVSFNIQSLQPGKSGGNSGSSYQKERQSDHQGAKQTPPEDDLPF